jgi:gluconolactonase
VFRTNSGGANGLSFDRSGNLVACEGNNGRITSASSATNITVRVAAYNGLRFNEPNDLWVDPSGGIYFTDPVYFGHAVVQGGEYVYYLRAGATNAVRVATDLVRPNGIVGTPEGQTLYIADWGASKVYRYTISPGGALTGKTLFASVTCDGMDMDAAGRLYLCENAVRVFSAAGVELEQISIPERPTNIEFGGAQRQFLFITTDGGSLYSVRMSSQGTTVSIASNQPPVISAVSLTPGVPGSNDTVCVTARIVDDSSVASVNLTYASGVLQSQTNLVFQETMRSAECKPWNGDGCANAWTVA